MIFAAQVAGTDRVTFGKLFAKRPAMKFKDIAKRMRGFSFELPIVGGGAGVEWEPPQLERDIAQRVITFLEDRRALFRHFDLEVSSDVVRSVQQMRGFLTDILQEMPNEPGLAQNLRYMRGACRAFLNTVEPQEQQREMYRGGRLTWDFCQALGELRAIFGVHLGLIATRYELGLEGDLATILPPPADDDPKDARR
jgi:hypothetical protein